MKIEMLVSSEWSEKKQFTQILQTITIYTKILLDF